MHIMRFYKDVYKRQILTITIAENTSATKANGDSGSKDGKAEGGISKLLGKTFPKTEFSASSSTSYEGKNAANASNVFNLSLIHICLSN